ncbi:YciI family protein [Rathayibacter sp. YIM 133350]|uniref:YciI family protein n=1 Tax=Rathayibacter sp. YIM 133350 TaxID=3131992 RepID=UPI00307F5D26
MRYLFFISTATDAEPYRADEDDIAEWVAEMRRSGAGIAGDRLRPPDDATTVKKRDGQVLVTDGPFAEGKEWIAGYDLVEAPDLDAAIAMASRHPMARFGQIEIRPLWPLDLPAAE